MSETVLLVGSGGREHALALALAASRQVSRIIAAPGSDAIGTIAASRPVKADDPAGLTALARAEGVTLAVIGPEVALAAGVSDALRAAGIAVFGPSRAAAQLESSKAFAKAFCARHAIPTADFAVFEDGASARAHLATLEPPYVLKADGLAAGKGVIICESAREADQEIDAIFGGRFGQAGARLVIEDFMAGEEASLFVLTDGRTHYPLPVAQDHKRAFDGDRGPNTGGMGAYAPAPVYTPEIHAEVMARIVEPVLAGMAAEGTPYTGVLFVGLMLTRDGPKVVEFNARFGDPECQTLIALLAAEGIDAGGLLVACARGTLASVPPIPPLAHAALTVVLAAQGYPDDPMTGSLIRGLPGAGQVPGVTVFHAGTKIDGDGAVRAAGGRVLGVTAVAASVLDAQTAAYTAVDRIDWPTGFCRRDIGWRAVAG